MKSHAVLGLLAFAAALFLVADADACPSCAKALAQQQNTPSSGLPAGLAASIVFMMSMPFLLVGFFVTMFFRLRAQADAAGLEIQTEVSDDPATDA